MESSSNTIRSWRDRFTSRVDPEHVFPFLRWRRRVTRATFRSDLIAGVTGAVVVLPQGVAFATIAGLPPQYGLYAGMIPAIIAALFGSSWHLVSGPTTAASVVLFSALSALAVPGSAEYVQLALTLTFMVGAIQFAMGVLRLGALVNFISHSVVVGFTAGAAILIAISQLKHFLGVDVQQEEHAYQTLFNIGKHVVEMNPFAVAVGLVTIAAGIVSRRWLRRAPYMLVAMLAGACAGVILNWYAGIDVTHLQLVGGLPRSLPPLSSPDFSADTLRELVPAAVAMTLFALTEAVTIARSLAIRSGQNIDGNQEFIGQGLSNLAGSFFSAYVATGSFNRSGVNYESGAKTPVAAVIAGVLLMGLVLVLAPLAAFLPKAAMAGILFLVAWSLIDFHHIQRIVRTSRPETLVLGVTFATALLLDLEFAILLGVLMSLLLYLMDASRPRAFSRVPDPRLARRKFTTDPALPECPQLKIVRIDGSLFFGAIHHVNKLLRVFERKNPEQRHLLLVGVGINTVDISGGEFLAGEARHRRKVGGGLYLCRMKENVIAFLRRGHYMEDIGEDNVYRGKTEAIEAVFKRLDPGICARCERRIFLECDSVPLPDAGGEGSGKTTTGAG